MPASLARGCSAFALLVPLAIAQGHSGDASNGHDGDRRPHPKAEGSLCADYSAGDTPDQGTCNVIPFGGPFTTSLTTLFASNNGGSAGGAVYFDLTVTNPIRLDQIGVNTTVTAGTPISMDVYLTANGGTSVGSQTNPATWSLTGSGCGDAAGAELPSYVTMSSPLYLPQGTYGVALVALDFAHRYTDGTGGNQSYSDANIALALGTATNVPFTAPVFDPRVANIEIDYSTQLDSSLQTLYASNNGTSTGGAVYFDVTVTNTVMLRRIDINTATSGSAIGIDLYTTAEGSTSVGNQTNPGAWTLVGSGTGTAAGLDNPSPCALTETVTLEPGTYGVAIVASGFGHRYTNGTGANQSYSDANIALAFGTSSHVPFTGQIFDPRVANITIHYTKPAQIYRNQRYQMLVRRNLISHTGPITGLAFAPCGSGVHTSDRMEIRMSHVPAGWTMSSSFASNLPSPVTVLTKTDNSWPLRGDQWNEVGLQDSFDYDGTSDLVVEVITWNNELLGSAGGFHRDSATPRIYNTGWSGAVPGTATGSSTGGQKVRLEFACANSSIFGESCGGLELRMTGAPVLGQSYSFDAHRGVPSAPIFLNLGFDTAAPFPLHLTMFGFTGCSFWHDIAASFGLTTTGAGTATFSLPASTNPALNGAILYGQYVQLNAAAPGGATFSGYGRALYGQ